MPFKDFTSTVIRQAVEIITCDPATRRIEGRLPDGSVIQIASWGSSPFFRWPREGEIWNVVWQNSTPVLDTYIENPVVPTVKSTDLGPGEARVDADNTHFTGGVEVHDSLVVHGVTILENFMLQSEDGTTWRLTVGNDGTLTAVENTD